MKRENVVCAIAAVLVLAGSQALLAAPTHVQIDTSGIGGAFELEVQLFSNSGSWAWIDNVVAGAQFDDFEGGGLGGFVSLNPGSVNAVLGNLNGSGQYVLEIAEDPDFSPTITFRDFSAASMLSLDLDAHLTDSDELLLRIIDPDTLYPLLAGLDDDLGDVFRVSTLGIEQTAQVTFTVVPVPGALGLAVLGLGVLKSCLGRRDNRRRVQKLIRA